MAYVHKHTVDRTSTSWDKLPTSTGEFTMISSIKQGFTRLCKWMHEVLTGSLPGVVFNNGESRSGF